MRVEGATLAGCGALAGLLLPAITFDEATRAPGSTAIQLAIVGPLVAWGSARRS